MGKIVNVHASDDYKLLIDFDEGSNILLNTLKAKDIKFNIFEIPNSAHNVLKDYGSKEAIKIICDLLERE